MNDKKDKDLEHVTSISRRCLKFWQDHWRWLLKEVIFAAVILTVVVPAIERSDQSKYQADRDMDNYIEVIRTLGYQDEVTYTYCQQREKDKIYHQEFDQNLMLINNERTKAFFSLLTMGKTLKKNHLLKGEGYAAVVSFGQWNNKLLDVELNVCSQNLKNPKELRIWTDEIISKIERKK